MGNAHFLVLARATELEPKFDSALQESALISIKPSSLFRANTIESFSLQRRRLAKVLRHSVSDSKRVCLRVDESIAFHSC